MAYIGVSPSNGVRRKHTYTATAAQTSFSGAGAEGITLGYLDSNYVDVYQNGVKLSEADYTSTSGTAIVLATGATVSDMIEVVVYDVFSVADTVSKSAGGTFDGNITAAGTITVTGNADLNGDLDVDGTTNLDAVDVDGAVNFAADVTFADGADIITATAGTSNFRAGVNAGNSIASGGNYNTVVGDEAGTAITTGDHNTAIGFSALDAEDAGTGSVAIGSYALSTQNADGNNFNTAVGYVAGSNITTGTSNVLIGGLTGDALTDADYNVAIGKEALTSDTLGSRSVAIGQHALQTQNFTSATNTNNVAVGYDAGVSVTTGIDNSILGSGAGDALTDADYNTAIGAFALTTDTLGSKSVAVGSSALFTQNFTSATDTYNTAVGFNAGVLVTTGTNNTLIGGLAGDSVTEGLNNVLLGYEAGGNITTGDGNVCIGYRAGVGQFSTTDNQLFIARSNTGAGNAAVWIQGNANGACIQGNNASAWTQTSDERIKKDIVNSPIGLAKIDAIQVRNFNYRTEEEITAEGITGCDAVGLQTGVIAQELEVVLPNAVTETETGLKRVSTDPIFWAMLKSIQELSAKNDALEARIKTLEG